MPYTIAWSTRGVAWTFYGTLTGKEAIQANLDIYGDPRFDDLRYQIVDISDVEQFDINSEDLEVAAALDNAATITNPHLVVAVVANKREAIKVAKAYAAAMESSSWKVNVFCSTKDAQEWIYLSCNTTENRGKMTDNIQ